MEWPAVVDMTRETGDGGYLATTGADGRPHVAWVGLGTTGVDGTLWTATTRSSRKGRNLLHAQHVALHWREREDRRAFGRGVARIVDDVEEIRELWNAPVLPYPAEQFFGSPENPDLLFAELRMDRVSVGGADPTAPPAVWQRTSG